MSDYEEYVADEKRDEMRDDRLIHRNAGNQPESQGEVCRLCEGTKESIGEPCKVCKGTGEVTKCSYMNKKGHCSNQKYSFYECSWRCDLYGKNPDPPEESQDERIMEAFEYCCHRTDDYQVFEAGFKYRDEEVADCKKAVKMYDKRNGELHQEITALRAQIEEMKCLYAENYRQLLNEAKSIYQHCPNNFRKTEDEYFLEENEFLAELEKEK